MILTREPNGKILEAGMSFFGTAKSGRPASHAICTLVENVDYLLASKTPSLVWHVGYHNHGPDYVLDSLSRSLG